MSSSSPVRGARPGEPLDVAAFLGLQASPTEAGNWQFEVAEHMCGGRRSIYGGCALAAGVIAAESATSRPAVWATCHFLGPAHVGETVQLEVHESSHGRAVSHVRVIATANGREVFICLISLGERDFPASGTWAEMPEVPPPDELPPRYILESHRGGVREHLLERAVTSSPDGIIRSTNGRAQVWVTLPGGIAGNAASLALIGDEVSTGSSAVIDPNAQAPSIDNTLRVVRPAQCDWVLADIELRAAANGFAHGIVNLWSPEGELLAIAEQTGVLRIRGT